MSVLSYQSIVRYWREGRLDISPFAERTVFNGCTYGVGPCGYDVRLAEDIWLWPFWGRKGSTIEWLSMPNDLRAKLENKSTWARVFVNAAQGTNLEPGWRGHITLELTRFLPWPIFLKSGTPILQVVFEQLDEPTQFPYPEDGKYQDQRAGPVAAIFEKGA